MKARGARVMFDPSAMPRPAMSAERFAALGENRVAYIKAIRSEEVAFLCAEAPLLPPGHCVFVLHAADGTPIMLAESREAVMADAAQREIETGSLHWARVCNHAESGCTRSRRAKRSLQKTANAYAAEAPSSRRGRRHR